MLFQGLAVVGFVLAAAYLVLNFPRVRKEAQELQTTIKFANRG